MPTDRATEVSEDSLADLAASEAAVASGSTSAAGQSPWAIARRRLWRNKVSLGFGVLFLVLVVLSLAAPLWADVAKTGPDATHETAKVEVDGKPTDVVSVEGIPLGPTYSGRYFLGADANGRDIAVRLLYGGRNSLLIGVSAALITALLSLLVSLVTGYYRGWTDAILSRVMDVMWAYPAILLGVALGTALATGGLHVAFISIGANSKLIPILVIALVYVPYMGRPLRGQVLGLREKEFVEAARAQGASSLRIMGSEILPNLLSTVVVFLPLMIANAILLEAALSFVGAGVQNEPTWGTMISDGVEAIINSPHLTIVPGLMLVLTVLSLNVFGDGVRDAIDPRAKVRVEH